MSEDEPDDPDAEAQAEETGDDEGTNSPVVETVKESDGETVNPNDGTDDATTGDGGASDGE